MSAIENVIDESIQNMTAGMVTKAAQEKVRPLFYLRDDCLDRSAESCFCL